MRYVFRAIMYYFILHSYKAFMLEKGYGVGKGIFTNPSQNDSVLSQHDSSKKIKQDK